MKRYLAEYIGTFILVFAGTTAIVVNDTSGGAISHLGVSAVFGLVVTSVIYTMGTVSGAHINPAVTLGFWFANRFKGQEVVPYLLSQFAGAVTASVVVLLLFPQHDTLGATLPSGPTTQSFVLEVILTFILMLTIINVATGSREQGLMAGVAIGGVVAFAAMLGGPVSGASMNPARSLGPALISGHVQTLWIYLVAPVFGTVLAILCCRCVREPTCCRHNV